VADGSVYYNPRPVSDADLKLMHRIDKLHMEFPFAGSRMLRGLLVQEGFKVGRLHVATMMKRMGIEALYRRPNTSKPAPGHKIYPYLLRKLPITRPNQVWAMAITYIPMARGVRHGLEPVAAHASLYLAAVLDWFTRGVCQRSCPPISCGVSDFRGADFGFWIEPDGASRLPVAGFASPAFRVL
jgi:putative transposase